MVGEAAGDGVAVVSFDSTELTSTRTQRVTDSLSRIFFARLTDIAETDVA